MYVQFASTGSNLGRPCVSPRSPVATTFFMRSAMNLGPWTMTIVQFADGMWRNDERTPPFPMQHHFCEHVEFLYCSVPEKAILISPLINTYCKSQAFANPIVRFLWTAFLVHVQPGSNNFNESKEIWHRRVHFSVAICLQDSVLTSSSKGSSIFMVFSGAEYAWYDMKFFTRNSP